MIFELVTITAALLEESLLKDIIVECFLLSLFFYPYCTVNSDPHL